MKVKGDIGPADLVDDDISGGDCDVDPVLQPRRADGHEVLAAAAHRRDRPVGPEPLRVRPGAHDGDVLRPNVAAGVRRHVGVRLVGRR